MNTNPQRTGYLTSEFFSTILTIIIGGLVASGKVSPDAGNTIGSTLAQIFGAVISLIAVVAYNDGRVELKKTILTTNGTVVPTQDTPIVSSVV